MKPTMKTPKPATRNYVRHYPQYEPVISHPAEILIRQLVILVKHGNMDAVKEKIIAYGRQAGMVKPPLPADPTRARELAISELGINDRVCGLLGDRLGAIYVKHLLEYSARDILAVHDLGEVALADIQAGLERVGLKLRRTSAVRPGCSAIEIRC